MAEAEELPAREGMDYDVVIVGGGGHGLATAYYLAKEHGIRAACHNGTAEWAKKRRAMGFDLVTISSDARFMAAGAQQAVAAMAGDDGKADSGGY